MTNNSLQRKHQRLKRRKRRNIIMNSVCLLIALSGLTWTVNHFWRYVNYEITNDAFIDQYIAPVSVRAAGYIKEVRFREHQFVHRGDTLLVLDDNEYRIRVKEAEAALLDANGSLDVLHSGIATSGSIVAAQDAGIAEAKAKLWQAEKDYNRYSRLLADESVPEQQFEQVKAAYEAAQARYDALLLQKKQPSHSSRRPTAAKQASRRASCGLKPLSTSPVSTCPTPLSRLPTTAIWAAAPSNRDSMCRPDRPSPTSCATPTNG